MRAVWYDRRGPAREVIATASSAAKAERARAGVDHVVDVDFGGNLAATLASVRENGSIAFYATNGDREPTLPVREIMGKNLSLYGMVLPTSPLDGRTRADIVGGRAVPTL